MKQMRRTWKTWTTADFRVSERGPSWSVTEKVKGLKPFTLTLLALSDPDQEKEEKAMRQS